MTQFARNSLVAWTTIALLIASGASFGADGVTIKKNPPTSETKVFDPSNPPPEKKDAAPNHPAFTWCNYTAHWQMRYGEEKQISADHRSTTVRLTITSFDVTLDLHSTIWLPPGIAQFVVEHERGHRQIGERSYGKAESIAADLAQDLVLGRSFEATSGDAQAAEQAARDKAGNAFLAAYLKSIRDPAQRVHQIYDEITNHGLNRSIAVDDAVQAAIERYRAERQAKRSASPAAPTTAASAS